MTKKKPSSSHIHLHTIIFLLFTLPYNGRTQNPNQEKSTLLKLKETWLNPPSLSHWTQSSNHCNWPEINCTNNSVTKLEIVEHNITGKFPPFICDLKNLTDLSIHNNSITGNFPTVLYNCSKLRYLNLSVNQFAGELPGDIDRLSPELELLNLGENNFSGDVPAAIGKLSKLKFLYLNNNMFNGSFPEEIGGLTNLEGLVLSVNSFSPQAIPSSFTQMKKLKNLWITEANLIGEIPRGMENMSALEFLDLSRNGLNGSIPDGMFLLENVTFMFLYMNNLSGPIPQRIKTFKLEVLDLSYNALTGPIPEGIGEIATLTGLALYTNQLSGEVPVNIGKLPNLIDVNLFSNKLSGELSPDFGRYSNLRSFQVSLNRFSGKLPENLCANKALIGVIAFENNLTGGLDSIKDCDTLTYVRVEGNNLSGEIPDGLWTSLNLEALMISNNSFTGELPKIVGHKLWMLELQNNRFSGRIPVEISSWESMKKFKASNNSINGAIPQELTSLSSISELYLDGNQLSGNIPATIVSWESLTDLNLGRNRISGEIPAALGSLPVLKYMDLSENEISGQIPPEIGRLALSSLNLSSNRLSGRIPFQFENGAFDRSFLNNSGLCTDVLSLGVASCRVETVKLKKKPSLFIAAVSSIAAVAFLGAFIYSFFMFRSYQKRKRVLQSTWKLTSFQRLNFTESNILSSLTENNVIGSGGSGKVYRIPITLSGKFIAVKKIWENVKLDEKYEKEFIAEVETLGTIRHTNIVRLLCCISGERSKLLVYEYMENCSLDRWIHGKRKPSSESSQSGSVRHVVLDWPMRLKIAVGAAQGLVYMHHGCSPPIVHRDVKSSNILLDSDFNAKIADFGLARELVENGEAKTMSSVAGSFGYMAPEYAQTRRVDEKIDVYSYGVVLLELVTGREAHNGDERSSLVEWSWRHIQEGKPIIDALDEDVKEQEYMDEINSVFRLGIMCTSMLPSSRPSMRDVLQVLLRHSQSPTQKANGKEYDIAPLLANSKHERRALEDSNFESIV